VVRGNGSGWLRACRSGVVVLLAGAAVFAGEPAVAPGAQVLTGALSQPPAVASQARAAALLALGAEERLPEVRAAGNRTPPQAPQPVIADAAAPEASRELPTDPATESASAPAPAASTPPSAPPPVSTAARPAVLPLAVDVGAASQVVTVVASSARATTAQVTAWQRGPAGWTVALGPLPARIGSGGIGAASEGSTRTPAGVFRLTEAFGRAADPGTRLPYRVVDGHDWWVSDVTSPRYNEYARCAPGTCDFSEAAGENLYAAGPVYDRAVVIDYNRGGTPGAGSAFFLHVSNGAATAGCVAIDGGSLAALMRWLDPAAAPRIALGVA